MVAKPGRNYALNKPVTIAELSSGSEGAVVDYERERLNLRKKHDGAIADAARNNQSRNVRMLLCVRLKNELAKQDLNPKLV